MAQRFQLSQTVQNVQEELSKFDKVFAKDIVESILKRHPEYGKLSRSPKFLGYNPNKSRQRNFDIWLEEINNLFQNQRVLHGKIVIIGLSILEDEIMIQLEQQYGFISALESELKEPLQDLLTPSAYKILSSFKSEKTTRPIPNSIKKSSPKEDEKILSSDRVGSFSDSPENHPNNDKLGRSAYARYLVQRILAVKSKDAFSMHIGGPWGSGKSTLLNFMKTEFEDDPNNKWIIVEFNAWQNQYINPPWWPLLDMLFQAGKKHMSWLDYIRERYWRIKMGKKHYFFFIVLLIAFSAFSILKSDAIGTLIGIENTEGYDLLSLTKEIGSILAALISLWAVIQSISSILMSRNSRTAESYLNTTTNPMGQITKRFSKLIHRITKIKKKDKNTRIAIFIDDMDRCQTGYVVDLLEGIQTLFEKEQIVFVVAADQRWLHACFEDTYAKLKPHVQEVGKGLGTLFLEKVFQFVVPMPSIPENVSRDYWLDLLNNKKELNNDELIELRKEAKKKVEEIASEEELIKKIEDNTSASYVESQLLREEAIVRLAAPELSDSIENHTLAPFAPLLNPNPRSMKRLVNTYSANRALSTLVYIDIPQKELAFWTILSMRWPNLARHLEAYPGHINYIIEYDEDGMKKLLDSELDYALVKLFRDTHVVKFVTENGLQIELNPEIIRKCAMLRM